MTQKMGRPTDLNKDIVKFIMYLAKQGKTDAEIAKEAGIAKSTLNNWKKQNQDFMDSLKEAKSGPDEEVEQSLLMRAKGYSHPEVKVFYDKDLGKCIEHIVTKHYPPSEVACIYWLKNRRPDRWRDRIELDTSKDLTIKLAYPESERPIN